MSGLRDWLYRLFGWRKPQRMTLAEVPQELREASHRLTNAASRQCGMASVVKRHSDALEEVVSFMQHGSRQK